MDKKNFAKMNSVQAVSARTIDELIKLGDIYNVIFVPYRPSVLKTLLEIIPNKATGSKFSQKTFADACTETAQRMGIKARGGKPLQITQRTVSNYCNPGTDGTRPDTDILEVMSEVLGIYLVPGLDRSVDTDKVLEYIKGLHK